MAGYFIQLHLEHFNTHRPLVGDDA